MSLATMRAVNLCRARAATSLTLLRPPRVQTDSAAVLGVLAGCAALLTEAWLRTDVADADPPRLCSYEPSVGRLSADVVRRLEKYGFAVLPGSFLNPEELRSARDDVNSILSRRLVDGNLPESVGASKTRFALSTNDDDVRQDFVCWIRETDGMPEAPDLEQRTFTPLGNGLLHCVRLLRGLTDVLEECNYCASTSHRVPKQLQLGFYPGDGRSQYVRHLDSCIGSPMELGLLGWLRARDYRERSVTIILYLNDPHWQCFSHNGNEGDGGALRIFHDHSEEHYTDVTPSGGTLVIFDSRRMEHQVLATRRDRFALTCWVAGKAGPRLNK